MVRITVSLPDDLAESVRREARLGGVSMSELIREALRVYLGLAPRKSAR